MPKRTALVLVVALLVGACGGDSEPTGDERPEDIADVQEVDDSQEQIETSPPTPTAVEAVVPPQQLSYTIQEGDLLGSVAQTFNVPLGALVAVNNMDNPDVVQIGQEVLIPTDDQVAEWEAEQAAAEPEPEAPAEESQEGDEGDADG